MELSRNELDTIKNKKIRASQKVYRYFSLVGASVLMATLAAPVLKVEASNQLTPTLKMNTIHPFLDSIASPATTVAAENDLYASVMMAQAVLESAWGQSTLAAEPNYNLFGIKGDYNGETTVMPTLEDSGNQNYYKIEAGFRKYPSYSESLEDYAHVLKNGTSWDSNYYSGAWKSNTNSYQDATQHLTGRYATDSAYDVKLNQIIESNELDSYDNFEVDQITPPAPNTDTHIQADNFYQVKTNDSLWLIGQEYGVSIEQIKIWNELDSDVIHPGQILAMVSDQVNQQPESSLVEIESIETVTPLEKKYTVENGDTLYSLASQFGMSLSDLKTSNHLTSDLIHPGQVLVANGVEVTEKPVSEATDMILEDETNQTYTVKNGDTLYSLASQFGMSLSDLKTNNHLTSDLIHPGQVLVANGVEVTEKPVSEATDMILEDETNQTYTVKNGDTLYSLASQFGMSLSDLKTSNHLTTDFIFPGQNLLVGESKGYIEPELADPLQEKNSYIVTSGDTLYSIARENNISLTQLIEWNDVTSHLIYQGQNLRIK